MERNMTKIEFQKNVPLAQLTTFKIGGPAEFFYEISDSEELKEIVSQAQQMKKPVFILGGGSNLLVSDSGFKGIVIKLKSLSEIEVKNTEDGFILSVDAGITLAKLLAKAIEIGGEGLEWAAGIPGTVGGTIFGNAGAYGQSMSQCILKVKTLNPKNFEIKEFLPEDCQFDYRDSVFKKNGFVILSAEIFLKKGDKNLIQKKVIEYSKERAVKNPPQPSAGCVFKNIPLSKVNDEQLVKIPPDKIKGGKIPVGYLIEQCGLKGYQIGGAQISSQHANFFVNLGNATAKDVYKLIKLAKQKVLEKFGLKLEEEIRYLGNF